MGWLKLVLEISEDIKIPDCNSGWMFSSPKAHNESVESQDKRLNRKLKPLIQIDKSMEIL